jgi:hypothetical protein
MTGARWWVDAAVMMADGRNTLRAIEVLRHQEDLCGPGALTATLCRALADIDAAALQEWTWPLPVGGRLFRPPPHRPLRRRPRA